MSELKAFSSERIYWAVEQVDFYKYADYCRKKAETK